MDLKIVPSLLAGDFSNLAAEIGSVEDAGADGLHLDIMDGHFVPNITMGPFIVKAISRCARVQLCAHLMIEEPERYAGAFVDAGADIVVFHIETGIDHRELAGKIKDRGARAGISLNPETPVSSLRPVRDCVDEILVMSVHPGFGGQKFIPESIRKIREIREMMPDDVEISVDGGITAENAAEVVDAGANILVAGTSVFGAADRAEAIRGLRGNRK